MQAIQNATYLELPALESRDERRFTGISSIFFNDVSLAIPSRLDSKGSAVVSERLPETICRISGWEDWTQGLEAVHSHYVLPDPVTHTELFLCLLDDCITKKDVAIGRALHALVTNNGLELESFFCVHLIRMFSSLNLLVEADRIFSKLVQPNVFAWSAIISAHTKSTESCHTIRLCHEILNTRVELDASISVVILKACATSVALVEGERTHAHVLELGLESDSFVSSALVNMYCKCGQLLQARLIFSRAGQPNLETWNSLIAGYVHHGHCQEALWLYGKMREGGLEPDKVTFLSAVKACSRMSALEVGEQIHLAITKGGFDLTLSIGNSLIGMYSKCGSLQEAWLVFHKLPQPDVVSWSSMIAGYAQHGFGHDSLHLFQAMLQTCNVPNTVTFICVVNACARIMDYEQGKKVHGYISECCSEVDLSLGIALVDMYAKCGSLADAVAMFNPSVMQSSVAWNTLIGGSIDCGCLERARGLFQQMLQQAVLPDQVSFACILKACKTSEQCKRIHSCVINGIELENYTGNILIDMYSKCGCLAEAKEVFDRLPVKNVVTWSTLIAGYVQNGLAREALDMLQAMQQERVKPNHVTFLSIMKACSSMAAVDHGKTVQAALVETGSELDNHVASALMDMYAKCGNLGEAHILFDRLSSKDEIVWGTLIGGHARHCDYEGTLKYFKAMLQAEIKPDGVTLLFLLSACSHSGLLKEGCLHFRSMAEIYGVSPGLEHYDCLLDLYSFAGKFDVAEDLLETIHYSDNIVGWKTLLTACRRHSNASLGRRIFEWVVKHEPENASGFALMSSTYTRMGLWEEARSLEGARRQANIWKMPAKACIEVDSEIHEFTVGDTTHPSSERIYLKLKSLGTALCDEGYLPQYHMISSAMSGDTREDVFCGHSERLAIAFGLLNTQEGVTLRVSKNFRVCNDCHSAAKLISRLERREIVISDRYCVHQFKDGVCLCRD